jgi:hypothetical protein
VGRFINETGPGGGVISATGVAATGGVVVAGGVVVVGIGGAEVVGIGAADEAADRGAVGPDSSEPTSCAEVAFAGRMTDRTSMATAAQVPGRSSCSRTPPDFLEEETTLEGTTCIGMTSQITVPLRIGNGDEIPSIPRP